MTSPTRCGHRPGDHDRQHDHRGQDHDHERHEDLERLELPELAPLLDLVDDVGGLHVAADVARGRPQRAGQAQDQREAGARVGALEVAHRVGDEVARRGRRERAEVLEQRVDRVGAGQPEQGQQHEQRGEEREHPVVGERRRQQRQVVVLELLDGALERVLPGALGEVGGAVGCAGLGGGHAAGLPAHAEISRRCGPRCRPGPSARGRRPLRRRAGRCARRTGRAAPGSARPARARGGSRRSRRART